MTVLKRWAGALAHWQVIAYSYEPKLSHSKHNEIAGEDIARKTKENMQRLWRNGRRFNHSADLSFFHATKSSNSVGHACKDEQRSVMKPETQMFTHTIGLVVVQGRLHGAAKLQHLGGAQRSEIDRTTERLTMFQRSLLVALYVPFSWRGLLDR
jgi:hypothetical protein